MTTEEFIEWRQENPFTGSFEEAELIASKEEFLNRKYKKKVVNE